MQAIRKIKKANPIIQIFARIICVYRHSRFITILITTRIKMQSDTEEVNESKGLMGSLTSGFVMVGTWINVFCVCVCVCA